MVKTACGAAILPLARFPSGPTEFVELDIVALDRHNQPITDLTQSDFEIKDGRTRVTIQSLQPVTVRGMGVGDERSVGPPQPAAI